MKFTDIFVRRPVLATVIGLVILVLGLRAAGSLRMAPTAHASVSRMTRLAATTTSGGRSR